MLVLFAAAGCSLDRAPFVAQGMGADAGGPRDATLRDSEVFYDTGLGMSDTGVLPFDGGTGLADGGSDAASIDASVVDGGNCTEILSCGSGSECRCPDGCNCTLSCEDECEARCRGSGTHCSLTASGVSNVSLRCERMATCLVTAFDVDNVDEIVCERDATCEVSCEETSNCLVSCESGSACLLLCGEDTSNCEFEDCEGGAASCPGRIRVCNRPCP